MVSNYDFDRELKQDDERWRSAQHVQGKMINRLKQQGTIW